MDYTIGTKVFRDWEIVAEIGEGSYGKVYQLRKENFGIVANGALKLIRIPRSPAGIKDALSQGMDEQSVTSYFKGVVDEFMREVAVMSDMKSHPNVVGCQDYDIIPHAGGMGWDILIRMDLLTPLQEYQTGHTMDESQVRRLGIDLCEALVYCQKRGLIHRDIKPGNIFVDELGRFRLGDFGVARTADKTMGGMSKQGTENYMAPEVYLGREYGPTVDIYSLGMVLYQLMNANRLPFYPLPPAPIEFSHRFEVLKKRMSGVQMPPPCNAGEDFAAIILKACAFDSKDRYRTATELLDALKSHSGAWDISFHAPAAPEQNNSFAPPASDPVPPIGEFAPPVSEFAPPVSEFAPPVSDPVPPSMEGFSFSTPTGDETIGPAFAPRPKAEPQAAQPSAFNFSETPKPPQEPLPQNDPQFQLIVEDAFNIPGRGVVVTGYVCFAAVHTGDPINILRKNGTQRSAAVAGIEHNRQIIRSAQPGTAVGILLSGMSVQDVGAGDKLVGKAFDSAFASAPGPIRDQSVPGFGSPSAPAAEAFGILGMELGETYTRISCMDPSGEIRTLQLATRLGYDNGRWCVGEDAMRCSNRIRVLSSPSAQERKNLTGRDQSMVGCLAIYLELVMAYARSNGMDGKVLAVSGPAFMGQTKKKLLLNAFEKAGLGCPRIYPMGVMAATRYCTQEPSWEGLLLHCHLGDDLSEVSLIEYSDDVIEVLSTKENKAASLAQLLNLQRQMGASLSEAMEQHRYQNEAAAELFPRLIETVQSVLRTNTENRPLAKIVVSGALAPVFRRKLASLLGQEPIVMADCAWAAAQGTAVMAHNLSPASAGNQIMLLNILNYTYQVNRHDSCGELEVVLTGDTTIPAKDTMVDDVTSGEEFLLFEDTVDDPDPDTPPIERFTAPFTGKAKFTLLAEADGIVRFTLEPAEGTVPRKPAQPQSVPRTQSGAVNWSQIVKQVMARHGFEGLRIGNILGGESIDKLRKTLNVPDDQRVLCYHDSSAFNNGKNGFVFTSRGIYEREVFTKTVFTSWEAFARGNFVVASKDSCKVDGKPVCWCNSGDGALDSRIIEFFKDLHQTMKQAL